MFRDYREFIGPYLEILYNVMIMEELENRFKFSKSGNGLEYPFCGPR